MMYTLELFGESPRDVIKPVNILLLSLTWMDCLNDIPNLFKKIYVS